MVKWLVRHQHRQKRGGTVKMRPFHRVGAMCHPARQAFLDNLGVKLADHLLWPAPGITLAAAIIKIAPTVGVTINQNAHRSGSKAAKVRGQSALICGPAARVDQPGLIEVWGIGDDIAGQRCHRTVM